MQLLETSRPAGKFKHGQKWPCSFRLPILASRLIVRCLSPCAISNIAPWKAAGLTYLTRKEPQIAPPSWAAMYMGARIRDSFLVIVKACTPPPEVRPACLATLCTGWSRDALWQAAVQAVRLLPAHQDAVQAARGAMCTMQANCPVQHASETVTP